MLDVLLWESRVSSKMAGTNLSFAIRPEVRDQRHYVVEGRIRSLVDEGSG